MFNQETKPSSSIRFIGFIGVCMFAILAIIDEWNGLARLHLLGYDYGFFYCAFQAVLHPNTALTLYNQPLEQAFLQQFHFPHIPYNQYVYPPQFAVFWAWLGLLPLKVSAAVWMLICILSFAAAIYCFVRILWPKLTYREVAFLMITASVLTPFELDAGVGNVDCILLLLFGLTFYLLYYKRSPWLAGIPLGLAIAFKVTPAALVVYLLLRRKWRTSVSAVLTLCVITLVTALILGTSPLLQYVQHFFEFGQTSMKNGPAPYNQSLLGVLEMFAQHHFLNWSASVQKTVFVLFVGIEAALILYVTMIIKPAPQYDLALACLTPLMFSPLVEQMHMLFAVPAILVLLHKARTAYVEHRRHGRRYYQWTLFISSAALFFLSLPATFLVNFITSHWPDVFWLHTQMFWVQIMLILALFVVMHQRGHRVKTNI